jgi:hypothetical protein
MREAQGEGKDDSFQSKKIGRSIFFPRTQAEAKQIALQERNFQRAKPL